LLIELVGGFGSGSRWLLDTSLYHQMAAVPAVDPDSAVNGVMIGFGASAALVGTAALRRKDLRAPEAENRIRHSTSASRG
jgi:hypothetical protein